MRMGTSIQQMGIRIRIQIPQIAFAESAFPPLRHLVVLSATYINLQIPSFSTSPVRL